MLVDTPKLRNCITIPFQTQPPEPIVNSFHGVLVRTFPVRILNPEKEGATIAVPGVMLRKEPIKNCSKINMIFGVVFSAYRM